MALAAVKPVDPILSILPQPKTALHTHTANRHNQQSRTHTRANTPPHTHTGTHRHSHPTGREMNGPSWSHCLMKVLSENFSYGFPWPLSNECACECACVSVCEYPGTLAARMQMWLPSLPLSLCGRVWGTQRRDVTCRVRRQLTACLFVFLCFRAALRPHRTATPPSPPPLSHLPRPAAGAGAVPLVPSVATVNLCVQLWASFVFGSLWGELLMIRSSDGGCEWVHCEYMDVFIC